MTASINLNFTVTSAGTIPLVNHVFVVLMENTNYAGVIGNSAMPYFNGLLATNGLATNYFADTHPSIGNYFMLTTGAIITNDDNFTGTVTQDNIVRELIAAGKTWKCYAESLPSVGYLGGDVGVPGGYYLHHNPFPFFSDVKNTQAQANNIVPFTQFNGDFLNGTLPKYCFIIPNGNDDMHDGTAAMADTWMQNNLGGLIQSMTNSLVIIVWDESATDNTNGGGNVVCALIGPSSSGKVFSVKPGYHSTTFYQHESVLRLTCQVLGVTVVPGAGATAPSMAEFFV